MVVIAGLVGWGRHGTAAPIPSDIFVSEDTAVPAEQTIRPLLKEASEDNLVAIVMDYPLNGSLFPPEIVAPTFLWHDPDESAKSWLIGVSFSSGPHHIYCLTRGARVPGEIDPRTVTETNVFRESDYQAAARGWTPDACGRSSSNTLPRAMRR